MILPGTVTGLEGVIGMTWDNIFLILPQTASAYNWRSPAEWNNFTQFNAGDAIFGEDGKPYKAKLASININPVGDGTGHWEAIVPLNLTGYTAEFKLIGNKTLTSGAGLTLGGAAGTVTVKMTPKETEDMPASTPFALILTDGSGNEYEYVKGSIAWKQLTP